MVFRIATVFVVLVCSWDQLRNTLGIGKYVLYPADIVRSGFLDVMNNSVYHAPGSPNLTDRTSGWLGLLSIVILSVLLASLWSVLDRKRANYSRFHEWIRVLVRFTLAATLIFYGAAKFTRYQFGNEVLRHLVTPVGDFAPPALMWFFMTSSELYREFTGVVELLAGCLLLWRRTVLLGALLSLGAVAQVFMMNLSYGVHVKLLTFLLMLLALFLIAPDVRRLAALFVFDRTVDRREPTPLFERRTAQLAAQGVLALYAVYLLISIPRGQRRDVAEIFAAPPSPVVGIYEVVEFRRNGLAAPVSDSGRWEWVTVEGSGLVAARLPSGRVRSFLSAADTALGELTLVDPPDDAPDLRFVPPLHFRPLPVSAVQRGIANADSSRRHVFRLTMLPQGMMKLRGADGMDTIEVALRARPKGEFLVNRWGVHVIQGDSPGVTWITAPYSGWPVGGGGQASRR